MRVKIQTINIWNFIVTILVTILFIAFFDHGKTSFENYKSATEQYHYCKDAALELSEASDYLTRQVRLYTLTGDKKYLNAYFDEVNQAKRREKALDKLETYFKNTDSFLLLQEALENSTELMQKEYYAMHLMLSACGEENGLLYQSMEAVVLSGEDEALSDTEKRLKAQELVSDAEYQQVKDRIAAEVEGCTDELLQIMKENEKDSENIFTNTYQALVFGIVPLVFLMFLNLLLISRQVVGPLRRYNACISEGRSLQPEGVAELRHLAQIYNEVRDESQNRQETLRYQAGHDALTKVRNRGAFEEELEKERLSGERYALILVDVDYFKQVNDTYGHAAGDKVLKKVGDHLEKGFREGNNVYRIGGDEFAVLLFEISEDKKEELLEQIKQINQKMERQETDVPGVSLSVGIAFSERDEERENIFRRADEALYYVKEHGKNGCAIYGDVAK